MNLQTVIALLPPLSNFWQHLRPTPIFNRVNPLKIIMNIKAQSGFKWDEERGANIDESTAVIWEAYQKVCSLLFDCIATICQDDH